MLEVTLEVLENVGIKPLTLVSGPGFHLVWAIPRRSKAYSRLMAMGRIPARLKARYSEARGPDGSSLDAGLTSAFAGLGLLMEFLWHRVHAEARNRCSIPIQPVAIEVGPGPHDLEIISFDLSECGDPLHTRHVRIPFSAYLKPKQLEWALGESEAERLLPIFEIPLAGMSLSQAITVARDPKAVLALAENTSVRIPESSGGMEVLLDKYQGSELAVFHTRFYGEAGDEKQASEPPPSCVQFVLEHPNDWLLKPAALQHVVRTLTALGWSPYSIAQRICSAYCSDCAWGDIWTRLEPSGRAIFYTRLFAGMIATGIDKLIDFNCVSHQEKGYCLIAGCSSNLLRYRDTLMKTRRTQ